jgi:hypothetical protein
MPSISEWLPLTTIRRRLWSQAKYDRCNIETELLVRQLIPNLIIAHVKNWYDGKPPTDSADVSIIEWSELLKFVSRVRPDIWPPGNSEAKTRSKTSQSQHPANKRKRGPKARTYMRIEATMREDIKSGRLTKDDLNNMQEKELEEKYGASRTTVRKARLAVLGMEIPTNSDKFRQT